MFDPMKVLKNSFNCLRNYILFVFVFFFQHKHFKYLNKTQAYIHANIHTYIIYLFSFLFFLHVFVCHHWKSKKINWKTHNVRLNLFILFKFLIFSKTKTLRFFVRWTSWCPNYIQRCWCRCWCRCRCRSMFLGIVWCVCAGA